MTIFVRHGQPRVDPDVESSEWSLDADSLVAVAKLAAILPTGLPILASDETKARETAMVIGSATSDPRLGEVKRPWTDDLRAAVVRYLRGDELDGWEPQRVAVTRFGACVKARRDAIYVTHGTVLSLYLATVVAGFDPVAFWNGLTLPDAWRLEDGELTRLT